MLLPMEKGYHLGRMHKAQAVDRAVHTRLTLCLELLCFGVKRTIFKTRQYDQTFISLTKYAELWFLRSEIRTNGY